jgi:hypothetical protein
MEYRDFLPERRRRMADLIRVAFRQLGGESDATPLTPPWFTPGAEDLWTSIGDAERALRRVLRHVYTKKFGEMAAQKLEQTLPEREREALMRALRARPSGLEPLSVVDYLYLGQIPQLLFSEQTQQLAREALGEASDFKQKLNSAISQIAPVRNEIAHIREVSPDRLLRAKVACSDIMSMVAHSLGRAPAS